MAGTFYFQFSNLKLLFSLQFNLKFYSSSLFLSSICLIYLFDYLFAYHIILFIYHFRLILKCSYFDYFTNLLHPTKSTFSHVSVNFIYFCLTNIKHINIRLELIRSPSSAIHYRLDEWKPQYVRFLSQFATDC